MPKQVLHGLETVRALLQRLNDFVLRENSLHYVQQGYSRWIGIHQPFVLTKGDEQLVASEAE
jgi:hypothetical protein